MYMYMYNDTTLQPYNNNILIKTHSHPIAWGYVHVLSSESRVYACLNEKQHACTCSWSLMPSPCVCGFDGWCVWVYMYVHRWGLYKPLVSISSLPPLPLFKMKYYFAHYGSYMALHSGKVQIHIRVCRRSCRIYCVETLSFVRTYRWHGDKYLQAHFSAILA
jgi:hypothetical protein